MNRGIKILLLAACDLPVSAPRSAPEPAESPVQAPQSRDEIAQATCEAMHAELRAAAMVEPVGTVSALTIQAHLRKATRRAFLTEMETLYSLSKELESLLLYDSGGATGMAPWQAHACAAAAAATLSVGLPRAAQCTQRVRDVMPRLRQLKAQAQGLADDAALSATNELIQCLGCTHDSRSHCEVVYRFLFL